MTPKEKAKELVEKFTFNCRECDNAKQSAIVTVDEVIMSISEADGFAAREWKPYAKNYWNEVKTEINNL